VSTQLSFAEQTARAPSSTSLATTIAERSEPFRDCDVTSELAALARAWLERLTPEQSSDFLLSVRQQTRDRGMTTAQVRAVLEVIRRGLRQSRDASGRHVPDGTFTVVFEGGSRRTIRVRTQNPQARFAPGRTCVAYLRGPQNTSDFQGFGFLDDGKLQLWAKYRDSEGADLLIEAVRVLVADPAAAAKAYGLESGRCGICGRELTVPESIEAGIGPVCAQKAGW